jgi:hypothetical protein
VAKDASYPTLELVKESKIHTLLPGGKAIDRFEASGVYYKDGASYVIFDNTPHIAVLADSLAPGDERHTLLRQRGELTGFEDITFDPERQRYYMVLEALPFDDDVYKPMIEEYGPDLHYIEAIWMDYALPSENKGIEGISSIVRDGKAYLLGMCEGNRCQAGAAGRKPGGGRIHIFERGEELWEHRGEIKLPASVLFEDYASFEARGDRVAVVSQMTAALWVGQFRPGTWEWVDEGRTYLFPRNDDGDTIYCNIEGVDWITDTQLVVVSDKRKPGDQPHACSDKDQSIHIFNLPS